MTTKIQQFTITHIEITVGKSTGKTEIKKNVYDCRYSNLPINDSEKRQLLLYTGLVARSTFKDVGFFAVFTQTFITNNHFNSLADYSKE